MTVNDACVLIRLRRLRLLKQELLPLFSDKWIENSETRERKMFAKCCDIKVKGEFLMQKYFRSLRCHEKRLLRLSLE